MSGRSGPGPALVVRAPGDVALETRPAPAARDGDLVAEPDLIGLCGTDLEIIDGGVDPAYVRYPVVLGHESDRDRRGPARRWPAPGSWPRA